MAAYKDKSGKWYVSVYYDNWKGERDRKVKRGFVNAPCLGQRLMLAALGTQADPSAYISRRKKMAAVLTAANIEFTMPAGTFYFFPKAPNGMDDIEFVNKLAEERILVVPGSGFGFPGYFRIALCVDEKFIDLSAEGFKRAVTQ